MGRFKRFAKRARSRTASGYKAARKPSLSVTDVLLAGAIYGVARPTISNMLPSFFKFGSIDSDNVILGGAGFMASKSSNKLIKSIGLIAMGTEAGIVTSGLLSGVTSEAPAQTYSYD